MLDKFIHQIWLGDKPIPDEFCLNSGKIVEMHRGYEYILWTDEYVQKYLCDKSVYDHPTLAGASNIVRLYALKKYGGIYLDMDFDILKPFHGLLALNAFVAKQPDGVFCNACMGATIDHPWINAMIDNYGDPKTKDASWGCHIIKDYITPDVTILPTDTFYPYNFDESPKPPTENTIAIHLWEGSWLPK